MKNNLIASEPIEQKVIDIVSFLKTTKELDKTMIGDFISDDNDFSKQILYWYIEEISFEDVPFVEGMKKLLAGFRLPGEGQKADRIMEKFGEKYKKDNPEIFDTAECVYLLAFATMMC